MMSSTQKNMVTVGSLAMEGGMRGHLRVVEGGRSASRKPAEPQVRSSVPLAFCVMFMLLALGCAWLRVDQVTSARVAGALAAASVENVTVMPGDSLWQIAAEHPVKGCTTEQVVNHIIDANDLSDAMLRPGMRLTVPTDTASC